MIANKDWLVPSAVFLTSMLFLVGCGDPISQKRRGTYAKRSTDTAATLQSKEGPNGEDLTLEEEEEKVSSAIVPEPKDDVPIAINGDEDKLGEIVDNIPENTPASTNCSDSTVTNVTGAILRNTDWMGTVNLAGETIVPEGIGLNIGPCTKMNFASGATMKVEGILTFNGAVDEVITMKAAQGVSDWDGITIATGGQLSASYGYAELGKKIFSCAEGSVCAIDHFHFYNVVQAVIASGAVTLSKSKVERVGNSALRLNSGGSLAISDTLMVGSELDLLVVNGGDLTVDHSQVGGPGAANYIRCGIYINKADSFTLTNSIIQNNDFGIKLGGALNTIINGNNFLLNKDSRHIDDISVRAEVGENVSVDATGNFWDSGMPSLGAAIDTTGAAESEFGVAGIR